jgi:hypothetical protein
MQARVIFNLANITPLSTSKYNAAVYLTWSPCMETVLCTPSKWRETHFCLDKNDLNWVRLLAMRIFWSHNVK